MIAVTPQFAVKIVDKTIVTDEELWLTEVTILQGLNHPNVVKLEACYESTRKVYVVMELVTGGELFDRIALKGTFSEKDASRIMRTVMEAVSYLHSKGVVHRDLKPENILMKDRSEDASIKLVDFGLAHQYKTEQAEMLRQEVGTTMYMAPEILRGTGYDFSVDVWAMGIITYILLAGYPPFYDEDEEELSRMIMKEKVSYNRGWQHVSPEAKHLVQGLLASNPRDRMSLEAALHDQWITGERASERDMSDSLPRFKQFQAWRRNHLDNLLPKFLHNTTSHIKSTHTKLKKALKPPGFMHMKEVFKGITAGPKSTGKTGPKGDDKEGSSTIATDDEMGAATPSSIPEGGEHSKSPPPAEVPI